MLLTTLALAMAAAGQGPAEWHDPFPAHKVIGNVYYVGSRDLATYLALLKSSMGKRQGA
jgi:metallo-beta-lactamase class B